MYKPLITIIPPRLLRDGKRHTKLLLQWCQEDNSSSFSAWLNGLMAGPNDLANILPAFTPTFCHLSYFWSVLRLGLGVGVNNEIYYLCHLTSVSGQSVTVCVCGWMRACKCSFWPNVCKHVSLSPIIISVSMCETLFYLPTQILWSSVIWLWQADGLPSLSVTDAPLHRVHAAGAQVTAGNVAHTANQPVTDMQVVLDDNPTHTGIDTQLSAVFLSLLLVME